MKHLSERKVPEHTALAAPPSWHKCFDYRYFILGPHSFTYRLALLLPHSQNFSRFLTPHRPSSLPPSSFLDSYIPFMPVDTVVDLRRWAGELAYRLGSLSHFMAAARELLDIIHHLSSEILLQHGRKVGSKFIQLSLRCSPIIPFARLSHSLR